MLTCRTFVLLQFLWLLQDHRPPAAIGSSPDGVTGGGKLLSISFRFSALHHPGLPAARGDRFLIRRRHGRRQNPG